MRLILSKVAAYLLVVFLQPDTTTKVFLEVLINISRLMLLRVPLESYFSDVKQKKEIKRT